jgi:hypothetical protein
MSIPVPSPEEAQSGEPALKVSVITAAVGALIAAVAAFGFKLTAEQTAAVMTVTTIVAPIVSGWFTRSRVYSPASVAKLLSKE